MKKELQIMGILNVTPDSFSDGGKYTNPKNLEQRIKELIHEGADIIDVGGESTGPGSSDVRTAEELRRVIPTVKMIRSLSNSVKISIDTNKSEVAKAAIENGATIINDVTALRNDEKMAKLVAESEVKVILMYSKDQTPRTSIQEMEYEDVINEIKEFLEERIEYAKSQGVKNEQIIIDPGMGHFVSAKAKYSMEIIQRLGELTKLTYPILLGISRKSFLGGNLEDRDQKGLPVTAIAYLNGASIIRTHRPELTKNYLCQI